jgi:hypothetical protein
MKKQSIFLVIFFIFIQFYCIISIELIVEKNTGRVFISYDAINFYVLMDNGKQVSISGLLTGLNHGPQGPQGIIYFKKGGKVADAAIEDISSHMIDSNFDRNIDKSAVYDVHMVNYRPLSRSYEKFYIVRLWTHTGLIHNKPFKFNGKNYISTGPIVIIASTIVDKHQAPYNINGEMMYLNVITDYNYVEGFMITSLPLMQQ